MTKAEAARRLTRESGYEVSWQLLHEWTKPGPSELVPLASPGEVSDVEYRRLLFFAVGRADGESMLELRRSAARRLER